VSAAALMRRAAAAGIGLRLVAGEVRFTAPRTAKAKRALADLRHHRETVRKFLLTEAVEITSSPDGSCDLCGGPLAWVVDWPQRGQARWLCPTCASWPALALSEAFAILRDDERERPAGEVENGHRLASHGIALPGREGA
jgi:hypothetical protein